MPASRPLPSPTLVCPVPSPSPAPRPSSGILQSPVLRKAIMASPEGPMALSIACSLVSAL